MLAAISGAVLLGAFISGEPVLGPDRISIVSAYLCLCLLSAALLIGPARAIRSGQPVLNHLVRRDLGIWAALIGFLHFALGMMLSMNVAYMDAFVNAADLSLSQHIRLWLYSAGNIAGTLVGVLFIVLLLLIE